MIGHSHKTAIWWVRRDLRLNDNQALTAALHYAEMVIPVFVVDPFLWASSKVGPARKAFLVEGLQRLDESLRVRASALIIRNGNPAEELQRLAQETGATAVFAEEDYSPYARHRDAEVHRLMNLFLSPGLTLHHPTKVVKSDKSPYTIFTPFSKAWKALIPPFVMAPDPHRIPSPIGIPSEALPEIQELAYSNFPAGEAEAQRRLALFTRGVHPPIYEYHDLRDRVDLNATSSISPYLRFGMISARQTALTAIKLLQRAPSADARKGIEAWLNELIWREFYQAILFHFPHAHKGSFREELRHIPWSNDRSAFQAWCDGRTGYPIVDAAMRQMTQTGWMHNRARMITASFLTKDLLIDWRWGEKFFMQYLLDGDLAANNGGWQWTAGTGTDAAPYFRIFNPILQSKKFDPDGDYIRRWVPELKNVPPEYVHTPWDMPLALQNRTGCRIGEHYPAPIIDHAWARERTLEAYAQAQKYSRKTLNE